MPLVQVDYESTGLIKGRILAVRIDGDIYAASKYRHGEGDVGCYSDVLEDREWRTLVDDYHKAYVALRTMVDEMLGPLPQDKGESDAT